jgi:4-amino-4-deoxy-L-arabinose transferase-like glycosyltransferase
VPSWIVFEAVMTKLPHYTMPMYPALALLSARAVFAAEAGRLAGVAHRWVRIGLFAWLAGLVAIPAAACLGASVLFVTGGVQINERNFWLVGSFLAVFLGTGAVVFGGIRWGRRGLREGRYLALQLGGVAAMPLIALALLQLGAPAAIGFSPAIAAELAEVDPGGVRPVASVGYHEDSLVFLRRGRLDRIDRGDVPGWMASHPGGLVVVKGYDAADPAWGLRGVGITAGLNITSGDGGSAFIYRAGDE